MKLLNKALDDTRKAGKNDKKLLKGHRFTFLWRKANLRKDKVEELETLLLTDPRPLGKAYRYKEGFFDAFHCPTAEESIAYLERWCKAVMDTLFTYMKKFVAKLRTH